MHGVLDPRTLSEWVLADRLPVRVQLQLHKFIWAARSYDAAVSMDAVVLLSGGLDSYTAAAIARAEGFRLYALTIRYGQRHAREIEAARAVARGARRRAAHRARRRPRRRSAARR